MPELHDECAGDRIAVRIAQAVGHHDDAGPRGRPPPAQPVLAHGAQAQGGGIGILTIRGREPERVVAQRRSVPLQRERAVSDAGAASEHPA